MKKSGFTLMELVTVIALIVVLSVISAPIYNSYASKARQAEGYLILSAIRSAQDNYFSDNGFYCLAPTSNEGFTANNTILGINAQGNDYYKFFNINDTTNGTIKDISIGFQAVVKPKSNGVNITLVFDRTTGATAI